MVLKIGSDETGVQNDKSILSGRAVRVCSDYAALRIYLVLGMPILNFGGVLGVVLQ